MSQSLAARLQQAVRTLELIEKVVKGPAAGADSEVILAPGVKVRTLARRVAEMTFGLASAADAEIELLTPQSGPAYALRGLSLVGPLSAQIVGPNIRIAIDLEAYATDEDIDALAAEIANLATATAASLGTLQAEKAGVAYVEAGLASKLDAGAALSGLADGGGFVRMTDAERAKLAALTANYKGSYASLAALAAAVPAGAAGDWAILTHGAGQPSTFAAWDSDNAPPAWIDTAATAPTTIDWAQVTGKPDLVLSTRQVATSGLASGGGSLAADRTIDVPVASQAEAEAGAINTKAMTPQRSAQAAVARGAGLRNVVGRNGGMEVWQRGTPVAVAASTTAYSADCWYLATGANQACTVSRQNGLVDGSVYAARVARNSGQTGTGTLRWAFPLDTDELARLRGKPAVLSFQVRAGANWSPAAGTLSYTLYCGTGAVAKRSGSAYTGETTPITGTVNLAAGGAAQQVVSAISAAIASGVTCAELQFAWTPVGAAGADDWVEIDDVQIERVPAGAGTLVPAFERRSYGDELRACQRHFNNGLGGTHYHVFSSPAAGGYASFCSVFFPVFMRAAPTVARTQVSASNLASTNAIDTQPPFFAFQVVASAAGNTTYSFSYTATAEI